MKKLVTVFVFSAVALTAKAQDGRLLGVIKYIDNQTGMNNTSISLLSANDSAIVKTALTDRTGIFVFESLKPGKYLVLASASGHENAYSMPITINNEEKSVKLETINLVPKKSLTEVVVVSKRPLIERKLDKIIVNVEAAISNAGTSALDVLEKAPGVTVDKDGIISIKGKQGVIILVDGKQTYLGAAELANFLRGLPSSNLDQLEIMTNPSSKYDAAGNSGIINIKTKKIKQKGFNGSLSTSYAQGVYPKTNNSLNLNYRVNKFNIFSTLSANYRERFQELDIYRRYTYEDKSTRAIFDQLNIRKKMQRNFNAKFGIDYYASRKTAVGIVLTGYTTPGSEQGVNTTYLKNNLSEVDSIVAATTSEKYTWRNGNINLNFRHQFDSAGREITADADYLQYKSDKDQLFTNNTYDKNWGLKYGDALKGELPSNIKVYTAKIDYAQPLAKGLKMEAGVKFSYVTTDNTAGYFNIVNGTELVDYDKTNRFQYKENVNAGYVSFSKNIKKWGLQAGLRIENTHYKGVQFGNPQRTDSAFSRNYTSAFPSAYISYNANEKNQWGLSFGRRINRPDYEDLNPFLFFLDKYTYGSGNPYLRPMFSQVFELSHTYKQFLTTTVNYSHTKDLFNETFEQQGFATIVRQGNYGVMNNASISVNAEVPFFKWWKGIFYAEGRYQEFKGLLYGSYLDVANTNFLSSINNQFSFKKGWSAELSGFYRTKGLEGQIIIKPIWEMNLGVQKQVLSNKATVKFNIRDIFYSRQGRGNINFQQTEASFKERNDSRVATLSFNYRFGKPMKGIQKRKTGGAGDEQNRIKSAN